MAGESGIKRQVFVSAFLGYVAYTLSRRCFTYAMPSLMEDLGLEKSQLGIIGSSWSLAYGLSKFGGGVLSDRVSPRWLFTLGLAVSGLTSMAFAAGSHVGVLAALWFLHGIFQGFGWPAITQLVNNWCAGTELASWWSALSSAGNTGLTLAPFLVTGLVNWYGWRATFFFMGCGAVLISAAFPLVIQDAPTSPLSPRSEREKRGGPAPSAATLVELCRNRMILLITLSYFLVSLVKEGWSSWGLLYLIQNKERESAIAGSVMFVFEGGGICGSLATGFISDYALKMTKSEATAVNRLPLTAAFALWSLLAYILLHWFAESLVVLYIAAFSIGCSTYGVICLLGVMSLEAAPRSLAGAAHAVTALGGQMGALSAGYPLGWIATNYQWSGAGNFLILTAALLPVVLVLSFAVYRAAARKDV